MGRRNPPRPNGRHRPRPQADSSRKRRSGNTKATLRPWVPRRSSRAERRWWASAPAEAEWPTPARPAGPFLEEAPRVGGRERLGRHPLPERRHAARWLLGRHPPDPAQRQTGAGLREGEAMTGLPLVAVAVMEAAGQTPPVHVVHDAGGPRPAGTFEVTRLAPGAPTEAERDLRQVAHLRRKAAGLEEKAEPARHRLAYVAGPARREEAERRRLRLSPSGQRHQQAQHDDGRAAARHGDVEPRTTSCADARRRWHGTFRGAARNSS